jgi:hypothetical protein
VLKGTRAKTQLLAFEDDDEDDEDDDHDDDDDDDDDFRRREESEEREVLFPLLREVFESLTGEGSELTRLRGSREML